MISNYNYSENLTTKDFCSLPVICKIIGRNNPGAVNVLTKLFQLNSLGYIYTGKDAIEAFDHLQIYGRDIWSLFSNVCYCSFDKLEQVLLAVAWEVVSEEELKKRIKAGISFVEMPSIGQMVKTFEEAV